MINHFKTYYKIMIIKQKMINQSIMINFLIKFKINKKIITLKIKINLYLKIMILFKFKIIL